jgi:hypothetical protein
MSEVWVTIWLSFGGSLSYMGFVIQSDPFLGGRAKRASEVSNTSNITEAKGWGVKGDLYSFPGLWTVLPPEK